MDYQEALAYIHSHRRFGAKPGLERMRALLTLLGNPQEQLSCVHIAGTNGKGLDPPGHLPRSPNIVPYRKV